MTREVLDRKTKLHIALTAAWMIFVFVQSALPGDLSGAESGVLVGWLLGVLHKAAQIPGLAELAELDAMSLSFVVRKAAHFTEYMVLGGLLALTCEDLAARRGASGLARVFCPAFFAGALYAVSDEIHQAFVPERACALMDMGIDAAGVAGGVLIVLAARRRGILGETGYGTPKL